MRHVAVDVETTGLNPARGDRVISIGCVELRERQFTGKSFHRLVDPQRSIPAESSRIHGITAEQVAGQPLFADLADEFLAFVRDAHLLGAQPGVRSAFPRRGTAPGPAQGTAEGHLRYYLHAQDGARPLPPHSATTWTR